MFDGVPDQFHQFITPRTSPLPLHLPFPLHASPHTTTNPNTFPPPFDPYNPSSHHHHHQLPLHQIQPNLLHPSLHHHQAPSSNHNKHEEKEENGNSVPMNFGIERDQRQQLPELIDPWTNDEVLALLRIKSSMESWFPELTWEHVSRKLAELGYKRSAEKCKEKFEEESRYLNNINYDKSSYRFLSELEELYQGNQNPHHHHQVETEKTHQVEKPSEGQDDKIMGHALEQEGSGNIDALVTKQKENEEVVAVEKTTKERKRKRGSGGDRFEMFKGFCESIVHKMMEQQEEMHNKLLEDMVRRDEEKFAREEAWKKQEMERMNKELEMMAQEQAIAGDRQANIIEFLKKFAPEIQSLVEVGDNNGRDKLVKVTNINDGSNPNSITTNTTTSSSSPLHSQSPNPSTGHNNSLLLQPTPSSAVILNHPNSGASSSLHNQALVAAENPSSSPIQDTLQVACSITTTTTTLAPPTGKNPSSSLNNDPIETNSVANKTTSNRVSATTEKDDIGRRWPKDEVLALINLRCTSQNNNNNNEGNNNDKEGNKAPLWERISQGMLELGYKRSAKRCKEKWENINKYFRKTKDANKKRSLDSRTCPYFHQLSNLYSQGKLVLQPERQENEMNNPLENSHGKLVTDQTQLAEPSQVGSVGFSVEG